MSSNKAPHLVAPEETGTWDAAPAQASPAPHSGARRIPFPRGYALAVVSVVLALVIRLLIDPWLGDQSPYVMFVVAVAVTGLYGGVRAASLATALGAAVAYFCFVPPRYHWGFAGVGDAVSFSVYLLASIAVILLTHARIRAAAKAEESLQQQLAAERRVVNAESLFRHFMDHSSTCAFLRDEEGRCVYANEAAVREFGMMPATRPASPSSHERASELSEQDRKVLSSGEALQFVERRAAAGAERFWLTSKFPFVDQSGRRFVGGISLEITDRIQAEEILRKTESLLAAGQMAALLAHEINNPLAALTNVMYLLEQESREPLPRNLVGQACGALNRINRIAAMTMGLYSDKEKPSSLRICAVLDEVVELLVSTEGFNHVRIVRDYRSDPSIVASKQRLRQLALGLLTNAVESGANTVRLQVRTGSDWQRNRTGVRIIVSDDGCGIARELRARVFEPFFSTKAEKGTGLGLWASRAIAYRNGGFVRLRSAIDGARRGTSVAVFFPTPSIVASLKRPSRPADVALQGAGEQSSLISHTPADR